MSLARTAATGSGGMLPELLAWSSSFEADKRFLREDLLGSLAHVTMLGRCKVIPEAAAKAIADELRAMLETPPVLPPGEEDVHMAVEQLLAQRLGETAGHLHTARSRNDQVALDLRLWCREHGRALLCETLALVSDLLARATTERETVLPAYTHRQRAQPVSAAMYFGAWAGALLRAAKVLAAAVDEANVLPLGSGASSGSSLPIDRKITAELLGFARVTTNALDTVGDRDFELDLVWACTRVMLALSRLSQDMVDFATSEFGFIQLSGQIAAGSSMMPQKKNPDVFELVRGKSAQAVGRLMQLLTLVKALPTGYNRDLQEDRAALFPAVDEARAAVRIVSSVLPHVRFDRERCAAAVASGATQATDLAEALVKKGIPFRDAYKAAGSLVRLAIDKGIDLRAVAPEDAAKIHPAFDLSVLDARRAVAAKESSGGTGAAAIEEQLAAHGALRFQLQERAEGIPSLSSLLR